MIGCSRYTAIITGNSRKYIQLHHDSKQINCSLIASLQGEIMNLSSIKLTIPWSVPPQPSPPSPLQGEKFPFPLKTDLICWFVPPEVALRMAQAASFLVLYSAPEFSRSANIGNMLQSITACNQRSKLSNSSLSQQPIKS